ncbi:UNVERIFIED_CONTAM: hypothetical protein PVV41_27265, partial [Salmonella enterica subsp. enterica serovar Typhimurium]
MSDIDPGPASRSGRRVPKPTINGTSEPDSRGELLLALQAMRSGDFSVRMSGDYLGIDGKIADTLNEIIAANQRMA